MNKTRREWSVSYKCCRGKRDSLTAFYSMASAIFIISISFYVAVYFFGSKYPDEILDENDITRRDQQRQQPTVTSAGPSASNREIPRSKKLVINDDGSDDEMLSGSMPKRAEPNPNLIALDNWSNVLKLHIIILYVLYIVLGAIFESLW